MSSAISSVEAYAENRSSRTESTKIIPMADLKGGRKEALGMGVASCIPSVRNLWAHKVNTATRSSSPPAKALQQQSSKIIMDFWGHLHYNSQIEEIQLK